MPLPTPKKSEDKEAFVSRCIEFMTKNEADRFPSREQRAAICYSQWDDYAKKHGKPLDKDSKKSK